MSEKEASELEETYYQTLRAIFGFMDDTIKFTSAGHEDPDIWSTIDDDDLNMMVKARLTAAKTNPKVAAGVRRQIALYRKGVIYMVTAPRAWQTLVWYGDHPFEIPLDFSKFRRKRKLHMVKQRAQQKAAANE